MAVAVAIWKLYIRPTPPVEVASKEKMAFPLPDAPSIAVLPFDNMSKDPKEDFFGDGITESIITALSKLPRVFVIARNSTFTYKGKPVKVRQVSEELGVQYILEGSVQRSANRIRIMAQLIDALTGRHIWAERYDRELKDLFALQDEITMKILTAMQVKLTEGEQVSGVEKYYRGKRGLDCYLKVLESTKYVEGHNIEDIRTARRIGGEAMAICPESAAVYLRMGYVHLTEYWTGAGKSPQDSLEKGIEMAQKALAIDDSFADAHSFLGNLYAIKREYDKAISEGKRAVALSPGSASVYDFYGQSLNYAGRSEEAVSMLQKSIRLNPFPPTYTFYFLGHAYRMTGRFEEAVSAFRKAISRSPDNIIAHIGLTSTYSMMGREKEARAEGAEVLRINPKFSLEAYSKLIPYKDPTDVEKHIDALRKAGLK